MKPELIENLKEERDNLLKRLEAINTLLSSIPVAWEDEPPVPVIKLGNTPYNSSVFSDSNLYRMWGTEDGGTIMTAYVGEELKSFKVDLGYKLIGKLLEDGHIGNLCEYDWKEIKL